jgi:hypothetical protein
VQQRKHKIWSSNQHQRQHRCCLPAHAEDSCVGQLQARGLVPAGTDALLIPTNVRTLQQQPTCKRSGLIKPGWQPG